MEAQRLDSVVFYKKRRTCKIIDFAVSGVIRIEEKEKKKIEKYQDLRRKLQKIWKESEDYTISCGPFRYYTKAIW